MEQQNEKSVREKDEATVRLLAQLKDKLYCGSMSQARRAAHQLSWMQEDGFEILKDALFDKASMKVAAAYGLRRVRGRMKPMAMEVLRQGLLSQSHVTREICGRTVLMLSAQGQGKSAKRKPTFNKYKVREVAVSGNRSGFHTAARGVGEKRFSMYNAN